MIGVIRSKSPIIIAQTQIIAVKRIDKGNFLKYLNKGMTSSWEIEYKSLGAPAKLYIPAPVELAIIAIVTN